MKTGPEISPETTPVLLPDDASDRFDEEDEQEETEALVQGDERDESSQSQFDPTQPPYHPSGRSHTAIVNLLCFVVFLSGSGLALLNLPQTYLVIEAVCRQLHGDGVGADDDVCKETQVQSRVLYIFSIGAAFDAMVCLFGALPWGASADRIGRKPVLIAVTLGFTASSLGWTLVLWLNSIGKLSIWFVWLPSAFLMLGGGSAVFTAVSLSVISDVTPTQTRGMFFMRIQGVTIVSTLLSPAASSALMSIGGPWPALWLGVGCMVLGAVVLHMFLPETLRPSPAQETTSVYPTSVKPTQPVGVLRHVQKGIQHVNDMASTLKGSPSLILIIIGVFLAMPIMFATIQLMIQYLSVRFSVKVQDVGYVKTGFGVAQIFQALVGLPYISELVRRRVDTDAQRDLLLARWSLILLIPCLLLMGVAQNLGLFILGLLLLAAGSGYNGYQRSLMSFYVEQHQQSKLFTLVGVLDSIGNLYSGPMLAGLFSLGIKLGPDFIGLPWAALALLAAMASGLLFFVRLPKVPVSDLNMQPISPSSSAA